MEVGVAYQTRRRCQECFASASPFAVVEVLNRGKSVTLRTNGKKEKSPKRLGRDKRDAVQRQRYLAKSNARFAALDRLRGIFPEVFAILYDEERAKRGLPPIARYSTADPEKVVSETLSFEGVYDALRSSGVTDGP